MFLSLSLKIIRRLSTLFLLVSIGFFSCKSKGEVIEAENGSTAEETIIDEKFKAASIIDYSERDSLCTYLIVLDSDGSIFQANSIDKEYLINGLQVWIDFSYSKMRQGPCSFGTPIIINRIKLRN